MKEFAVLIGQMRRRFGHENSPLCTCVLTAWGSRNICATALKTLREWGLDVDEVHCLAGAPCSPILAVVKPHILWDGGLHNMRDLSAPTWESIALGWTHKCCFPFHFNQVPILFSCCYTWLCIYYSKGLCCKIRSIHIRWFGFNSDSHRYI